MGQIKQQCNENGFKFLARYLLATGGIGSRVEGRGHLDGFH